MHIDIPSVGLFTGYDRTSSLAMFKNSPAGGNALMDMYIEVELGTVYVVANGHH